MAIIKSGDSSDLLKIDATSKAARVTLYDVNGNPLDGLSSGIPVLPVTGRTLKGNYSASTWRILGTAATPQNIATIINPAASGRYIAIKALTITIDSSAALATVAPSIKTSRPAAEPTGGTGIQSNKFDTSHPAPVAEILAGNASDGGGATAITATAGVTIWTAFVQRLHTAVGWVQHLERNLLPPYTDKEPYILAPGEAILVQGVTAIPATTYLIVNFAWEEYE